LGFVLDILDFVWSIDSSGRGPRSSTSFALVLALIPRGRSLVVIASSAEVWSDVRRQTGPRDHFDERVKRRETT
jgi:hypothetical protein